MTFFIPSTKDAKEAEKVYDILRKALLKQGYKLLDDRVYEIEFEDNGMTYTETVGKSSSLTNETVLAIFDTQEEVYLICTTNRGVLKGQPLKAGKWATHRAELFQPQSAD